jgi:hypothetical protein
MAGVEELRGLCLSMPGAEEIAYRGNPWFNVGTKSFVLVLEGRTVMKLGPARQEFLFEARPEVFTPFRFGPNVWAYVEIEALAADELAGLVREAWAQIVPKKVSRAYLGTS